MKTLKTWFARISRLFPALLIVFFFLAGIANATDIFKKSYSMPQVDIAAEAQSDGSLHVVEQREFDFKGRFTAVWWEFGEMPYKGDIIVHGVRIQKNEASGTTESLVVDEVAFQTYWRSAGGPGKTAYSYDEERKALYTFFSASDEKMKVTIDYTIINGATAYSDMGEVYWKFVSDGWAEPARNISMDLTLPVPEGESVSGGDNVLVWGHGPLDGSVNINDDGTIHYQVPGVSEEEFAEARVIFPVKWLSEVSEDARMEASGKAEALAEEEIWAAQADSDRFKAMAFLLVAFLISLAIVVITLVLFFRYGKDYKPSFTDEYWRDVPSPGDHPATIARLWRQNAEKTEDFTATLMNLTQKGAIQINKGVYQDKKGRDVSDYYLVRIPTVANTLDDPIDRKAMDILFNQIAKGKDSLWFKSIEEYGDKNPRSFLSAMKEWQATVSLEVSMRGFFENRGKSLRTTMIMMGAILYAFIGVSIWVTTGNTLHLIFVIPTVIVMLVVGHLMRRRSPEATVIYAKSKALRNWLKDFSALDERPPTDVKVWGQFMVYAFIFGVAKQVLKELKMIMPEIIDESTWSDWYSDSSSTGGSSRPVSDLFQTTVSSTTSSARAAVSASSGSSSSSSSGGGGGFSGGGGGGHGGGGGGGAR